MSDQRILVTCPGRHGDIIWSLPTARAISEAAGHPVDFLLAGEFGAIRPLLIEQPYLQQVYTLDTWAPGDCVPPLDQAHYTERGYDQVIHLGYRRWPAHVLPEEIYLNAL